MAARRLPCPSLSAAVRVGANKSSCATSAEFGTRLLSDQLSDYRVDDPYIHAHLHGPSSRLVLALDDSPTVLRDEEVTAAVAAIVTSCLTIWPGSTCRVSTLSIRRGQHQPQPVFSDLCDPEIESYLVALAAFDASTLSSHLFVPRDIRSSASRFFRSASGSAWRYFCVVWIW
jgi:hypothetical protein